MEDSGEIEIVAENSDNNNTENSNLQKNLFQTFYENQSQGLEIIEKLEKAFDDSSARKAQLLSENERLKKELKQRANPTDVEQNVPVLSQVSSQVSKREYDKAIVEKDEKIQSLKKDIENLLNDPDRNQRLTFVHKILKKQKEEAIEKSAKQRIEIITLQNKCVELTAQLEKSKGEVLKLQVERNDESVDAVRKLLEDSKKENVELRVKNDSLEKKLTLFNEKLTESRSLCEESNTENHKLKTQNETLQNSLKEKDKALKASQSKADFASSRFRKAIDIKKFLQVKLKEEEECLAKSKKEVNDLEDDLRLKEEEFEEEILKLRVELDANKKQTDYYHIEVRELRDKNRKLEIELDKIDNLARNSDNYNEDQLEGPRITFNNDLSDESWESEGRSENGRKRRRVVTVREREDYSESEEERPRRSVFSRLGKNKIN